MVQNVDAHDLSTLSEPLGDREVFLARHRVAAGVVMHQSTLQEIEEMYDLAAAGYLSPEGARTLVGQALERIQNIREDAETLNGYTEEYVEKLGGLERRLGSFQANGSRLPFEGMAASEVATYRKVFQALAEISPSPRTAKELMEAVLARI